MQRALARVWHRFAYTSHPKLLGEVHGVEAGKVKTVMQEEDAFATIMQWLYGRIGQPRAQGARPGAGEGSGGSLQLVVDLPGPSLAA